MAISTLGIVGSGIMGSGIAEVAAKSGIDVILRSRQQQSADAMVASLERSLAKQVERGKLEEATAKEVASRVSATDDLHALHDCDLVLESVVEDLAVKKELFTRLDDILLLQMQAGLLFALFIWLGLSARQKDPGFHKRMMLIAPAMALGAAFARMTWLPTTMPNSPLAIHLYQVAALAPLFETVIP